jgi:hypothetical protein
MKSLSSRAGGAINEVLQTQESWATLSSLPLIRSGWHVIHPGLVNHRHDDPDPSPRTPFLANVTHHQGKKD